MRARDVFSLSEPGVDSGYSLVRMSQFLSRGHLRCVLLCSVMATLSVYFSNIRGYHQGFTELSASALLLRPNFIALVETHLVSGESLQMYLPPGYVLQLVMTTLAMVVVFYCCVGMYY